MRFSTIFLAFCVVFLTVSCAARWSFQTGNEKIVQEVRPRNETVAVSTTAKIGKDAENLRVAIEGELLSLKIFGDVVLSCDKADYCLHARFLGPEDDGYEAVVSRFGQGTVPTVVGVVLEDDAGRRIMSFDLGGVLRGGGLRPAFSSGAITVIGTEVARQIAAKVEHTG